MIFVGETLEQLLQSRSGPQSFPDVAGTDASHSEVQSLILFELDFHSHSRLETYDESFSIGFLHIE